MVLLAQLVEQSNGAGVAGCAHAHPSPPPDSDSVDATITFPRSVRADRADR